MDQDYRQLKVAKGNGKFRDIYAPQGKYKDKLKSMVFDLNVLMHNLDETGVSHAFISGKNCVTNAEKHIGFQFTLSMDLADFFDCVRSDMLPKNVLKHNNIKLCFIDGVARQGLNTSPAIANIAFLRYDKAIVNLLADIQTRTAFTRYADDLTISFDDESAYEEIRAGVEDIISNSEFELNISKTKLQKASSGNRIITGIAVNDTECYATRKVRRKMRAAKHQNNADSFIGLKEWSRCKKPKSSMDEIALLRKLGLELKCSLSKVNLKHNLPAKKTCTYKKGLVISGEHADMYLRNTSKLYSDKHIPLFILLEGARIAFLKQDKTPCGVMVFELINGITFYLPNSTSHVEHKLDELGVWTYEKAKGVFPDTPIKGSARLSDYIGIESRFFELVDDVKRSCIKPNKKLVFSK